MTLQLHRELSFGAEADRLDYARQIVRAEAQALELVAGRLGESFLDAVDLIASCTGRVAVTGIGKSADVAQKIMGTLNSTGTRAYMLDPTRAVHGDLGMVHPDDVVLILSHSGESEEIIRLLGPLHQLGCRIVALTGNRESTLAHQSDAAIAIGPLDEVCPLGLAPSSSTTAALAVGDAMSFLLCRMRGFSREEFARNHPAGSLGRKLLQVEAIMRQGSDLRIAGENETVREVFAHAHRKGRRTGAVMLVDATGRLTGLFTDSDLARLIEMRRDGALDRCIAEVMTRQPHQGRVGMRVAEAVEILRRQHISELPIVDGECKPVGLLDITDVLGLVSAEEAEALAQVA